MTDNKLHPDADKAVQKLIAELWGFQIETDKVEESNEKFNAVWSAADDLLVQALELLGFDSLEDWERDIWASKPSSEPVREGTGILDLKVTGFKEVSA